MGYPPAIEQLPYNWWTDRAGQAIVAIIAHGTVGKDSRAYLSRGGDLPDGSDKKVSVHALIQKPGDPIYRYVPDERGANHAGYGTMPPPWTHVNPNKCTLSFELENLQDGHDPYPAAQLLAMGWLINSWRAKWGHLPIYRHADIDPTRRTDTVGLSVAQIEEWAAKAAADPLKTHTIAGPNGILYRCSKALYDFYHATGRGFPLFGYALSSEADDLDASGNRCSYMRCERATMKHSERYGAELALMSEALSQGWV